MLLPLHLVGKVPLLLVLANPLLLMLSTPLMYQMLLRSGMYLSTISLVVLHTHSGHYQELISRHLAAGVYIILLGVLWVEKQEELLKNQRIHVAENTRR